VIRKVRTRFAPSPTGFLHVGGVRTALFAWLVARQANGSFILRIEDTDQARQVPDSVEHIMASLKWLGLDWDEGPYFQSKRRDTYKHWAQKLIDSGHAYADPYTPEQVQEFRDQAKADKRPFLYGAHRPLNPPSWHEGQPLRFKSQPKAYKWEDVVMGKLSAGKEVVDDFIILKSDGFPTYNFAHIIDDHEMKVTHVIRGQEFVASMPNYLNLYDALDFPLPQFATLPHILNPQGNKKLSKRDGAKDILDYRQMGYLPEAMVNFLASLGWNDGSEDEVFSVKQLIEKFDMKKVQRSGARFDEQRLRWLNGAHIRKVPLAELYRQVKDYWPNQAIKFDDTYKRKVLALVQERLKYFAELPELTRFFYIDLPVNPKLINEHKQLKKLSKIELKKLLGQTRDVIKNSDFSHTDLSEKLNGLLNTTSQKPVVLFSLIRIATTQAPASPGLAETLAVLGKDTVLKRIIQTETSL